MDYFDLHCDTVTSVCSGVTDTAVTPKKAKVLEKYAQLFAVWMDDALSPEEAFKSACAVCDYFSDYVSSFGHTHFQALLTLENGTCLGDDLRNIEFWKDRGVSAVTLTWNGANLLGFGSACPDEGGLTDFGKNAVKELQSSGILVDVSHLNEAGFYDCVKLAKKPLIASHSNCFSICPHSRNLKDEQIKELFDRGGIMGICYYPRFLGNGNVFELIYEHIYHGLELGGEDSLCLGSDFDGAEMSSELDSLEKVRSLHEFLAAKGIKKRLLEKIFYKNAENFFNNILHA